MYYYEDLYMSEMAEVLGVSESRISQLHSRAIYELGRMMSEHEP
jgi:RNA polymerase sigma factor for flagellar operon FliA